MGKVSEKDFNDLGGRLRTRAMMLMEELDRLAPPEEPDATALPAPEPDAASPDVAPAACPSCGTANDGDARFCKQCGGRL